MSRRKWTLKRLAKGLFAVVLIAAVIHGVATFILGRMVESEIARIKATGDPVALADLGKDIPPDSENAAVIYDQIFSKWSGLQGKYTGTFGIFSAEKRRTDPQVWQEARTIVASSRDDLALAEVAVTRTKCRFQVNWEAGYAATFRHLARMRTLTRLLATRAIVDAADGEMAQALHSIDVGFKLSESLKDEPSLISQLVRCAIIHMCSEALRGVVEIGNINQADARKVFDTLSHIDLKTGMVKAMKSEIPIGLSTFGVARRGRPTGWSGHMPFRLRLEGTLLGRPLLYADELRYLRVMNKTISMIVNLPYRASEWRRWDEAPPSDDPSRISDMLLPFYSRARGSIEKARAELAGCQVLLALEAYRSRLGTYPATLEELKSKLRWKLPADPFSGRGFVYRRQPRGFLLYSVGLDMKDNGGAEMKTENSRWLGDIVWKMER